MESVELYVCRNPKTGKYKPNREGSCFGEPLGNLIKLYKRLNMAEEHGARYGFPEIVKVKLEVIE